MPAKIRRLEDAEQIALFEWRDLNVCRIPSLKSLFAVFNGSAIRGSTDLQRQIAGHRQKLMGLKPGVFDVQWPVARGPFHGLFVELKPTGHKRKIPQTQLDFQIEMRLEGYSAEICIGWDEARMMIERYHRLGAFRP